MFLHLLKNLIFECFYNTFFLRKKYNMDSYDYYGKYEKKIDNSFSVYEIHKKQKAKLGNRSKIYNIVLGRAYKVVRNAVETEATFCFFEMPEYIIGHSIYNMTECLLFIINKLSGNGYQVKYCHPRTLYITWPMIQQTLALENGKSLNSVARPMERPAPSRTFDRPANHHTTNHRQEPDILKNLKLNYRSTNEYKPSGSFVKNNKPTKKTLFF